MVSYTVNNVLMPFHRISTFSAVRFSSCRSLYWYQLDLGNYIICKNCVVVGYSSCDLPLYYKNHKLFSQKYFKMSLVRKIFLQHLVQWEEHQHSLILLVLSFLLLLRPSVVFQAWYPLVPVSSLPGSYWRPQELYHLKL